MTKADHSPCPRLLRYVSSDMTSPVTETTGLSWTYSEVLADGIASEADVWNTTRRWPDRGTIHQRHSPQTRSQ